MKKLMIVLSLIVSMSISLQSCDEGNTSMNNDEVFVENESITDGLLYQSDQLDEYMHQIGLMEAVGNYQIALAMRDEENKEYYLQQMEQIVNSLEGDQDVYNSVVERTCWYMELCDFLEQNEINESMYQLAVACSNNDEDAYGYYIQQLQSIFDDLYEKGNLDDENFDYVAAVVNWDINYIVSNFAPQTTEESGSSDFIETALDFTNEFIEGFQKGQELSDNVGTIIDLLFGE